MSGYYAWLKRVPNARTQANVELLEHIRAVHHKHRQAYGALKTGRVLNFV